MVSRKSRILALSAVLLTLVFVVITSHANFAPGIAASVDSTNTPTSKPQKIQQQETTTRIGVIDEKKIKINEDKIQQQIQLANGGAAAVDNADNKVVQHKKPTLKQQQQGSGESEGDPDFNPVKEFKNIMSMSPVVVFSKTYCGFSKALKNLLQNEYELNPAPAIVELDKHKNGRALQDYIAQNTGHKTVPNLFINGISRGGSDEMRNLHEQGKLLSMLNKWGGSNVKAAKVNAPSNS